MTLDKLKKISALLFVLLFSVSFLASCSQDGLQSVSGKTLMTIGNYKFTDTEYNYFYQNYIDNESYSDAEAAAAAENDLRHYAAVLTLCKKYDIALTDSEKSECEEELSAAIDYYGSKEEFESAIALYNMTSDLYLRLVQLQTLETDLRSYMIDETSLDDDNNPIINSSDEVVLNDIKTNFYAIKQIFICNDEGDDITQNKEIIESIYDMLLQGADFDALMDEYNETDSTDSISGYFTDGMLLEEIENTAKVTDIGSYSDIVETKAGYSIIFRLPLNDDYIDDNFEDLRFYYQNRCFNEILQNEADSLSVK